jgi:hypothetical protein
MTIPEEDQDEVQRRRKRSPAQIILEPGEQTPVTRRVTPSANQGLRLLNPTGKDAADYMAEAEAKPIGSVKKTTRVRYQRMAGHMEMAAQALAVGTTQRMAAKYAGVTERQIKKYYADPDFRVRIDELRQVLASRIRGKLIRELNRRTNKSMLQNMDLLDVLRIWDRITTGGKGVHIEGDVNIQQNQYDGILQQIFAVNSEGEGEDFPSYGDPSLRLPSGDPQE